MTARRSGAATAGWDRGWLVAAAATVTLLVLGLHEIRAKGFWYDEAVSVDLIGRSWGSFLDVLANKEANGSLYFFVLRLWSALGDSEARLRALSVLFAVGTIPLLYDLGRRAVGPLAAALACVLLATSVVVVQYAQDARMYTMAMFLATATVLAWWRAGGSGATHGRWWAVFAGLASALIYAHAFGAFVVLALGLVHLAGGRPRRGRWVIPYVAPVLTSLPLILYFLTSSGSQLDWIGDATAEGAVSVIVALAGGSGAIALILYGTAAIGVVGADAERRRTVVPIVAWLVVPLAVGLTVSVVKSVLVTRYYIVALPPLMLLAGLGIRQLVVPAAGHRLPVGIVALAAVLALSGTSLDRWYGAPRTDWRASADWVARTARPDDRIIYYRERARVPFQLYLQRMGRDLRVIEPADAVRPARTWLVLYAIGNLDYQTLRERLGPYRVEESKLFHEVRVQLLVPEAPS